jgi:predicted ATP-grasp superfamily ATP-dependent carboligase
MHSYLRVQLPKRERRTVLIAATSGRALAQSAARAGFLPLTADFFCDLDTLDAGEAEPVQGDFAAGFEREAIMQTLRSLADGRNPLGVIYGSGFEATVAALEAVGREFSILGNDPAVVAQTKDPADFAITCARLGIPHPATLQEPPASPDGWLRKQRGGSGGSHVVGAIAKQAPHADSYYQRQVCGTAVSALFLADRSRAVVAGFSEQWSAPTPDEPYRYGGAIRPAQIEPKLTAKLAEAVGQIAEAYGLRGLNSADFIVNGREYWLLEVNPRPGATVDIFDDEAGWLMQAHIAACRGELPHSVPVQRNFRAAAIVYAEETIAAVPEIAWPDWALDRQGAGTRVEAGWPLCTVTADADTRSGTLEILALRERQMKCLLGGLPA